MTSQAEHAQTTTATVPARTLTHHPYLGIVGVFLGAATSTITGRLLTAGLPDLRGALGYGFDEASWIPTVLNMGMVFTGVFAVFLAAVYGVRRVLLVGGAVFTAAAVALPFAPGHAALLALEAVAGLAIGPFYTLTLTFVARNLPPKLLLFGIAAYAMDIVVSSHVSTYIHGWYMEHWSWRWIYWTSAVLMPVTMLFVHLGAPPAVRPESPNWRGFLLMSGALALIYGALDQGQRLDWWRSGVFVGMLAGGVFLTLATLVRRFFLPNPLVNLRFLGPRNVLMIGLGIFVIRLSLLASLLLIPSFLTNIQRYGSLDTGRALAWVAAPELLVVWIAAILVVFIQPRILMASGFAMIAVACWMASRLDSQWSGVSFARIEMLLAVGIGTAFVSLVTNVLLLIMEMGALDSIVNTATYSAFMHTIRLMGGEVGAVVLGRFLSVREQLHSNLLGLHVDIGNGLAEGRLFASASALQPVSAGADEAQARGAALLAGQVKAQAFTLAYSDSFLFIAWVIAAYLVLLVFLRPSSISLRHMEKAK